MAACHIPGQWNYSCSWAIRTCQKRRKEKKKMSSGIFTAVSSVAVIVHPEWCPVKGMDSICVTAGCFRRMSSIAAIILLRGRLQRKEEKRRLLCIWASVSVVWQLLSPDRGPCWPQRCSHTHRAVTCNFNAPKQVSQGLISAKIQRNHWNDHYCFFRFFFFLLFPSVLPVCLVLLWLVLSLLFLEFPSTHVLFSKTLFSHLFLERGTDDSLRLGLRRVLTARGGLTLAGCIGTDIVGR